MSAPCAQPDWECAQDCYGVCAVNRKADPPPYTSSDIVQISSDAFNRGALTTYRSLRYSLLHLDREQVLEIMSSQIAELEAERLKSRHRRSA